ncbi:transposase [Pantoea sp. PSNIH1]|uniref:transposase n=1 Tax=Pantoea sp. PSNIH1 TaxID=1484158 RepID=UPI0011A85E4D|nr:transposase [Pantoea sp. PSNIH1]
MRNRKNPRLTQFDYRTPGAYFVTLVTRQRALLLGEILSGSMHASPSGLCVAEEWERLSARYNTLATDTFIVMPNHLHGIIWLQPGNICCLSAIINHFKAGISRQLGTPVWQRGFYDRVIRSEQELSAVRRYIAENPLKWELDRLFVRGETRHLKDAEVNR